MAVVARDTEPVEPIAKLRRPSRLRLVDGVTHSLEDAILAGRMRPGERLIETKLCDELAVSRTTLREALLMLERRGLVRSEPRRGTFVTRLSREESMDLCATRAILEAYAVSIGFDHFDAAVFARVAARRLSVEEDVAVVAGIFTAAGEERGGDRERRERALERHRSRA
jgi:DNA-binding GntR family transcriptional regulator